MRKSVFVRGVDVHQPVGALEGQRPQQHGVDNRKDRRVGTDAQGHGQNSRQREGWALQKTANCEFQVGDKVLHFLQVRDWSGLGSVLRRQLLYVSAEAPVNPAMRERREERVQRQPSSVAGGPIRRSVTEPHETYFKQLGLNDLSWGGLELGIGRLGLCASFPALVGVGIGFPRPDQIAACQPNLFETL